VLSIGMFNGVKKPPVDENQTAQNPAAANPDFARLFLFRNRGGVEDPVELLQQGAGL
jgi:hypothetical protein